MSNKEEIVVVWLKRDLRLHDNESISSALKTGKRVLLVYAFERALIENGHYSQRHWSFIKESLIDINTTLKQYNSKVLSVRSDVFTLFNTLRQHYNVTTIFSHQETGLLITYERDKKFAHYCKTNSILWQECINNGVIRGLKNRDHWFENWNSYMLKDQIQYSPQNEQMLSISEVEKLELDIPTEHLNVSDSGIFQKGGTRMAWKYANSFFKDRYKDYMYNISKPAPSRTSCSRLSPYIAWGNISVRELYQKGHEIKLQSKFKRHLSAFLSRLRWQAHFIQKFEMEHIMEHVSVNKGYHELNKDVSEHYQKAWREGNTGFPLVDASMRCLNTTGYLNFRMRAMLVSFFTHILWQPWQDAAKHLAQQFLDFEPGIHFPQLQMQAGETGINNLRIYNPIKNGIEHDPEAVFIKKWVPELAHLDTHFVHEPYLMTPLEEQFYNFKLGIDYPNPIVNIKQTRKYASDILWSMKKNNLVKKESIRILKKHTITDRNRMLRND